MTLRARRMIEGLKPYPAMKDSGVPWLGEVPEHWGIERLKSSVSNVIEQTVERRNGDIYVALEHVESWTGRIRRADSDATFESQVKRFRAGDVLFGKLRPYLAKVTRPISDGVCVGEFLVLRPRRPDSFAPYLEQLLRSKPVIDAVNSSTFGAKMPRADWHFLGGMPITLPPLPEQAAIVRFLDHVDRRIRRYIRAKQKLIKLLEELKAAFIHRAVTRGLDPNVRLKPSGVEWLGDVPEHWDLMRVKQVTRVLRGKFAHRPRNDPSLYDGQYPFIQTGEVARAGKSLTSFRQTLNQRGLAVSKLFPAGTLVMTIAANIGDVAILDFDACFPDSVVGFVPRARVDRDFLYYLFVAMKPELLREAPVNTHGNLNVDRIGARAIALPSEAEQQAIVRWIEASCASLTGAVDKAGREVSLLREYRTRLIADVVTGKLDVREAAARLPDEAEEPEPLDEAEVEGEAQEADADQGVPEEAEA